MQPTERLIVTDYQAVPLVAEPDRQHRGCQLVVQYRRVDLLRPRLRSHPPAERRSGHVYVTTYSSAFNNQGHLYSIDAVTGGVGNNGTGYCGSRASNAPGSYNYNVNPVSYWSFPDK